MRRDAGLLVPVTLLAPAQWRPTRTGRSRGAGMVRPRRSSAARRAGMAAAVTAQSEFKPRDSIRRVL